MSADYDFAAYLENVKSLHSLLKAIAFRDSATFCATERGLKITVEQGKCVQASAYVPVENFFEYATSGEDVVEFKINLIVLTECLNIFDSEEQSSVKIYYKKRGSPLILMLENKCKDYTSFDDFTTDCQIKTQETDELMYFKSDDAAEAVTVVVKGQHFMNIINDLDKNCENVEFQFSNVHPHIAISTSGYQDRSRIEIPKTSDIIHSFFCEKDTNFKYKLSHIRLTLKSLALSSKVALKIDSRGLLIIQHMIEKEEQKQMFIEFYITPLVEDEDDI